MSRLITAFILACSLVLVGCAGMSKKDCVTADWYNTGLQDGRAGYPETRMSNYVASCAEHDVGIDQNQYLTGHDDGIRQYCQPENGYQVGLRGRALPQVCPADMATAFAREHARGYLEFKIKRDISDAQQKIDRSERDLLAIEAELVDATAQLYAKGSGDDKKTAQQAVDLVNNRIQGAKTQQVAATGQLACASGDWYQAGVSDGDAGRSAATFKRHVQQCQDYHPATNQQDYIQGQSAGLQRYCSYENGIVIGKNGRTLSSLCQGTGKRNVERGYAVGLENYNEKVTVAGLKLRRAALEQSAPALAQAQARLEQELQKPDLTSAQKITLTRQLNRAKLDRTQLEVNLTNTTNEMNCYIADWQVMGFEAGERGDVFNNPSATCESFGLSADTRQYQIGYDLGLSNYCTTANGRAVGQQGLEYKGVCPRQLEPRFLDGYLPAYREYQRQALKRQLTVELEQSNKLVNNVKNEIDVLSRDLEQPSLTRAEKLAIINEVSALSNREKSLVVENEKLSAHSQCLTDDWLSLGKTHGTQGLSSQLRILNCERFDESPNSNDYHNGLSRGLLTWCTYARGYDMAVAENTPSSSCSKTTHREYYRGYNAGLQEIARAKKIDTLKLEKLSILEKKPSAEQRLAEIDAILSGTNLSTSTVRSLKQEKLNLQKFILESDIRLDEIKNELALLGA